MSRSREKNRVEDHRRLQISTLNKDGVLQEGWRCNWNWLRSGRVISSIGLEMQSRNYLRLHYQLTRHGQSEQLDYQVRITWTPCHLGGERPWFLCPCCGRRVAILYLNRVFACRHCQRLNYASQQAGKRDLACDQSWKLRRALGCDLGFLDLPAEFVSRPKGMHRHTFARKISRLQRREDERAVANMGVMLERLGIDLERAQSRLGEC